MPKYFRENRALSVFTLPARDGQDSSLNCCVSHFTLSALLVNLCSLLRLCRTKSPTAGLCGSRFFRPSSCRVQLLPWGPLGHWQPLIWSQNASSFSHIVLLELISCFVPEALPLNHSPQSHCASPENEGGLRGPENKSVNIKEMWLETPREEERDNYNTVLLFCV